VRLHEVENPLLEVVKHADLHCLKEVELRKVAQNTVNMSKHVESLVNIAQQDFGIGCLGVGIAERCFNVVIQAGALLARRHKIYKFVFWTLAPKADMPLEMM
jgi:hypothetical protein